MSDLRTAICSLTTVECRCGGVYAISTVSHEQHRREGTSWSCPYCRAGWGFVGNGTNERLKREKLELEATLARERARHDQTKAELEHTERRRRSELGAKTRIKNRISAGVCPCCNRTFQNLWAHMKGQHPNYAEATGKFL